MTKILGGFRKCGKTTELIKMAHNKDLVIVTFGKHRARAIFEQAQKMKLDIRYPATIHDFPLQGYGRDIDVVVDDVENVLFELIKRPIKAITSSFKLEEKEVSFTLVEMLQGKAPKGLYRIDTGSYEPGNLWHGVLVDLLPTTSGGYGVKLKTDPNDPSSTPVKKGHLLPLCGITNGYETKYILVEEY